MKKGPDVGPFYLFRRCLGSRGDNRRRSSRSICGHSSSQGGGVSRNLCGQAGQRGHISGLGSSHSSGNLGADAVQQGNGGLINSGFARYCCGQIIKGGHNFLQSFVNCQKNLAGFCEFQLNFNVLVPLPISRISGANKATKPATTLPTKIRPSMYQNPTSGITLK